MDTTKAITHISLCSGYEGIGLGLRRVLPNLREIAYVERDGKELGRVDQLPRAVFYQDGLLDQANPNTNGKSQESWSTPQARGWKGAEGRAYKGQTKDLPAQTESQGKLNPNWVEHLMGLPVGWTQLPTAWIDSGC